MALKSNQSVNIVTLEPAIQIIASLTYLKII